MNNINEKDDTFEKYKKLAIEVNNFVDNNKNIKEITNELFNKAVDYLATLYNSYNDMYCKVGSDNLEKYKHLHILHKKTCNKVINFTKKSEIFEKLNINLWDQLPYIWRYNNDLMIIKRILKNAHDNIKKCKEELNNFINSKKSGNNDLLMLQIDFALPWILNSAISLRYSLELIIFQLKNNNVQTLTKLNNKISFFDLLTKYECENIDFNIKDLSNEDEKLIIKDFWTKNKLCEVHTKLSEIVHFQDKKHLNWNFKLIKELEKYVDVESIINYLIIVLNTIYISIKDHNVSFENSKFSVNVKNFYIDIEELFNVNIKSSL